MIVMIVDDSLLVLKTVESQIKGMPDISEVILCSNSMQTLDIIKQKSVDIVIMDVMMPDMNGLEVLSRIRQDTILNDVQVIMLTSEPEFLKESFNLGSDDFINKPFESVELQSRLKAAVKTRKSLMLVNEMNRQLSQKNHELVKLNKLLKETQLSIIQNEKMASIGELAAGVAHEINNPLGFVKSNIETLSSFLNKMSAMIDVYRGYYKTIHYGDNNEHGEYTKNINNAEKQYKIDYIMSEIDPLFGDIKEGIARVVKIVSTLTSFAHAGLDGEYVLNSVSSIIEESLLIIRNEYKYSIEIHKHLNGDDEICCNKGQIEQVLVNILMNAIHAIKSQKREEKGQIHIYTERGEAVFRIRISDDGPGIPEDFFNRIFDPFFTTKDVGQGTGLGLSISYDIIVNKHGGQLSISNQKPSGAVFDIELPIRHVMDDENELGGA